MSSRPRRSTRLQSQTISDSEHAIKEPDGDNSDGEELAKRRNRSIDSYFQRADTSSSSDPDSGDSGDEYALTSSDGDTSEHSDDAAQLRKSPRVAQRTRNNPRKSRVNHKGGVSSMAIDSDSDGHGKPTPVRATLGKKRQRVSTVRTRATAGRAKAPEHLQSSGELAVDTSHVQRPTSRQVGKTSSGSSVNTAGRASQNVTASLNTKSVPNMVSNHFNAMEREKKKRRREKGSSEYRLNANTMTFEEMALKQKRQLKEFETIFGNVERRTQGLVANMMATLLEYQELQLECVKQKKQYDDPIVTGSLNLLGMGHLGDTRNMTDKEVVRKLIQGSTVSNGRVDKMDVTMPSGTVRGNVSTGAIVDNTNNGDDDDSDGGNLAEGQTTPVSTPVRINTPVRRSVTRHRRRRSIGDNTRGTFATSTGGRGNLAASGRVAAERVSLRVSLGAIANSDDVHTLPAEQRVHALPDTVVESYLQKMTIERGEGGNVAQCVRFREMTSEHRAENVKQWKAMMLEMSDLENNISMQFNDAFEQLRTQMNEIKSHVKRINVLQANNDRLFDKFIKDRACIGTESQTFFMYNTALTTGTQLYTSPFDRSTLNQMYEEQHTEGTLG